MDNNRKYIVVSGPVAAGKSSLADILARKHGFEIISEDLSANLFFEDFMLDMQRWGFHVAVSFLVSAIESQRRARQLLLENTVCQDWFVREYHEVYNTNSFETGLMAKREFLTCNRLYNVLLDLEVLPNLVIVLQASEMTIMRRLFKRQRQAETTGITAKYVSRLLEKFAFLYNSLPSERVLKLDCDKYDFVNSEADRAVVLELIGSKLQSIA